jgi:hypothetical protein
MEHIHTKKAHKDMKTIAAELQREVDVILGTVDEKTLFAEFHREEMIDFQNGGQQEAFVQDFDERIVISPRKHTKQIAHKKSGSKKISNVFRYLFTRFEY